MRGNISFDYNTWYSFLKYSLGGHSQRISFALSISFPRGRTEMENSPVISKITQGRHGVLARAACLGIKSAQVKNKWFSWEKRPLYFPYNFRCFLFPPPLAQPSPSSISCSLAGCDAKQFDPTIHAPSAYIWKLLDAEEKNKVKRNTSNSKDFL